jgi:DNA polymerase-3 subunit delta'
MNYQAASDLPWLAPLQEQIRRSQAARRLPHSLLLVSAAGLGVEALAEWTLGLALCESAVGQPCGTCPSCTLLSADSHPDAHVVRLEEDAQQIKVDQVRALIEALVTKSYRGGYKVGLILGAESLNVNGANAFLKTLEEPTANTMLIMTARPAHRLPATIASRCLKVDVRMPERDAAERWLRERDSEVRDWQPALALAGGAPLLARDFHAAKLEAFDGDMRNAVRQLAAGAVDITVLADQWVRTDAVLCVTWLENWITTRLRETLGGASSAKTADPIGLPAALLKPKIQRLFRMLDAVKQFKRLTQTGMNQQLALEALLLEGRAALEV